MKVHDAFSIDEQGPLFPPEATAHAVYVVRNPLDVAVSYANHSNSSIDAAVARICDGHVLASSGDRLAEQLEQRLLSWSEHVKSWANQRYIPVHTIRFEDMLADPLRTFTQVVTALDLPLSPEAVQQAIEFSTFDVLRAQEERTFFREGPASGASFFHRGRCGTWPGVLTSCQIKRIVSSNRDMMRRFGYLTEDGDPVTEVECSSAAERTSKEV